MRVTTTVAAISKAKAKAAAAEAATWLAQRDAKT